MIFVEALFVFVFIAFIWLVVTLIMFKKLNKARITGVLLILLAFIGVGAVIFVVGHALEWHETNEMCGELCHAMEPPYNAYTKPKNNTMIQTHFEEDIGCAQCHSGPGFIGLGKSFLPVPEEGLREYLMGYDNWKFDAPMPQGLGYNEIDGEIQWQTREIYHPMTRNGTTVKELEKLETCLDCHDARDNSIGFTKEACSTCHEVDEVDLETHAETTYQGEGVEIPDPPKLTGHNTVEDNCMVCHNRDHPDNALVPYDKPIKNAIGRLIEVNASFCTDCHEEAYNEFAAINSKHYIENDCTECHLEHKTRPDCLSCHNATSGIEPLHVVAAPFDDCTSCHEQGGHNPMETSFQSLESAPVSKDFCNSCHQEDVYDEIEDNKLHTKQEFTEDCLSCHDTHEADIECTSCHVEGGFGGLAEPPEHNITQPFDDCLSCHEDGHIPERMNFTLFQETYQISIGDEFCDECHQDERIELETFGVGHASEECSSCHETHEIDDVDCLSCHNDQGPAFEPPHPTQNPYDDCLDCHESGHAPRNITFPVPSSIDREFCAGVSCHGGPDGASTVFENYGENHESLFNECTDCHSQHEVGITCTDSVCHSSSPPSHDSGLTFDDCIDCHQTAHDPLKRAPRPGYNLSQRDFMSNYFILNETLITQSFNWISRGDHQDNDTCMDCHSDYDTSIYPPSAQILMNVSGTDCSLNCHEWIDPTTTFKPIDLLNQSSNPFPKHMDIFKNATTGGCAGSCHQSNPSSPVFDGSGHGVITNCLDSKCHGPGFVGFSGPIHDDHKRMIVDYGAIIGVNCDDVSICHESASKKGAPIDGGCYDCHKSGHDPVIMTTSVCYAGSGCHDINQP
jgi:nitrate/TMAO reductase-like tetraheme cytochrome c subunit